MTSNENMYMMREANTGKQRHSVGGHFGTPCYYWVPCEVGSECCYSFEVGGGAHSEMNNVSNTCGCSLCYVLFFLSYWLFVVSNHSDL